MKSFLILTILFASQAYAAHLNLNGGESAVIQANVNTSVTCGGSGSGGSDCSTKASSLKGILDKCMQNLNAQWCIENTWPKWKANNPSCVSEGSQVCIDKCVLNLNAQWCMTNCQ